MYRIDAHNERNLHQKTHFPLNVDDRPTDRPTDGYGNGENTSKSLWRKIRNKTENDMMIN